MEKNFEPSDKISMHNIVSSIDPVNLFSEKEYKNYLEKFTDITNVIGIDKNIFKDSDGNYSFSPQNIDNIKTILTSYTTPSYKKIRKGKYTDDPKETQELISLFEKIMKENEISEETITQQKNSMYDTTGIEISSSLNAIKRELNELYMDLIINSHLKIIPYSSRKNYLDKVYMEVMKLRKFINKSPILYNQETHRSVFTADPPYRLLYNNVSDLLQELLNTSTIFAKDYMQFQKTIKTDFVKNHPKTRNKYKLRFSNIDISNLNWKPLFSLTKSQYLTLIVSANPPIEARQYISNNTNFYELYRVSSQEWIESIPDDVWNNITLS